MVFSSNIFLFFFLPAVLILYYTAPRKGRNFVLLAVSLFFYGWGEPVFLLLMVFTIAANYLFGLAVAADRKRGLTAKRALVLAVAVDLGLLGVFKYAGFFAGALRRLPFLAALPVPEIVLPIGISFYIFQSMSYVADVYRGAAPVQRDPVRFGTYVSMFPQLIAGPIVRYRDVAEQLEERRETLSLFASGVRAFIIGLAKKLLLANQMGTMWESLQAGRGAAGAWAGMLAYTLHIYFDFSGYSDMAIGLGRMFGFEFLKNFDYPYISRSVTEFWRRWHISLSSWFREYVYIPLGGNRRGLRRQLINILIVWALTGLWHGANWNFVLWGLYYALLLIAEKLFLLRLGERLPVWLRRAATLLAVAFGWMLFCFEDMGALGAFLVRLFAGGAADGRTLDLIAGYLPITLVCCLGSTPLPARLWAKCEGRASEPLALAGLAALLLLCAASLATQSYNPFIYFRF